MVSLLLWLVAKVKGLRHFVVVIDILLLEFFEKTFDYLKFSKHSVNEAL